MHRPFRSVCTFCRSSTTRIKKGITRILAGSSQHQHASLHLHAALCTNAVTLTPRSDRASSSKQPILRWSILRRNVSLARSPASLRITSRGIQQRSGPSHDTTQSNKPFILPAVYVHSGRELLCAIRTETRLGKRACYDARLACLSHLLQG
jgi:hypothetical protein